MEELLRLDIKSLFYGDKTILRDLELSVSKGERILIVGATGAGKSSLLKTLNLMNQSYEGSILLQGEDLRGYEPEVLRSRICLVMQEPFLEPGTVQEALDAPLHYHALRHRDLTGRDQRVKNLFKSFQLGLELMDQSSEKLSGGEKQRVLIARSLAQNTPYILLDETLSQLDINHQVEIMALLRGIVRASGKGILLISHNLNLGANFADRMVFLAGGRVLGSGTPEEMMRPGPLRELFGLELQTMLNPASGKPNLLYPGVP